MIYIAVFLASVFFAALAERSKDKGIIVLCSVISILIPSILGGLRAYGIGTDTRVYARPHVLQAFSSPDFIYFFTHNKAEPVCKLITYSAKILGHENWCYFFYHFTTLSCFYIGAYKHRKNCSLPFLMFTFYMLWYNYTYNVMRQCLAASVIFMGYDTLENRQYLKFLIYVTIATLCHYSAVIAIILLLSPHVIITSKNLARHPYIKRGILFGAILMVFVAMPIANLIVNQIPFLAKYRGYIDYAGDKASYSFIGLAFGQIIMLTFYFNGALKTLNKFDIYGLDFHRYNLIIIITITTQITLLYITKRFLLYSHFVNLILLSSLPDFVKEKNMRIIMALSVISVSVFFWWYIYIHKGASETWPYRSIL